MDQPRPVFNQLNIVSGDVTRSVEFYRKLGIDIPEANVWRTPSGVHHVNAASHLAAQAIDLEFDSTAFAQLWNTGWKDRTDLAGRVFIGLKVASRAAVDEIYRTMTAAGHRGLQPALDAFFGSRFAILQDPDGIAVGLISPRDPSKQSDPPAV
jgi:predicted lactoylglutathione lyase